MPRKKPNQIIENGEVIYELKPLKQDKKFIVTERIIIPIIALIILLIDRGHFLIGLIGLIRVGIAKLLSLFI